jgi:UDP-galactopyranose mutase
MAQDGSERLRVLVIGAGFAGACVGFLLRERFGAAVTIVERASAPGGMLRTLHTAEGLPYEYGPRVVSVFRGTADVLPFLRRFLDLQERRIYQGTRLRPDYPVIPFPVDRESLRNLPCGRQIEQELIRPSRPAADGNLREYLESTVGPTLTELAFAGFNRKFWGRELDELPADWGRLRQLHRIADHGEFRLPSRAPHYYPRGGFNDLFDRLLDGIDVCYGVDVLGLSEDGAVLTRTGPLAADLIVGTAPLDALLGYRFGALEWRGYRLELETAPDPKRAELGRAPDGVPFAWLYTPWPETPVCRTTDFGAIHHGLERSGPSVVAREIPDERVRMYPVWWDAERLARYLEAASRIPRFLPLGRLGLYKYVTVDTTFEMVNRMLESLDQYLGARPAQRVELLRHIRGDWSN